ncbi:MAG: hypothetical protein QOF28_2087, partial [Actinomycetota bacterium]|nr:hypothetical protein [Actinomycetota bacterium]
APVPDLRCAIVVDDSDAALQEERTPTWHARELLAERCRRAGGRLVVVSAAPSVEAEVLATVVHAPPRAVEAAGWPRVEVVDRGEEPPSVGLLSERLARALHDARDAKGPAVCVLNRRGRVRLFACATCLRLVRWDRDGAPVWDKPSDAPAVIGSVPAPRPDVCPHCGGTRLRVLRSGITRVREELAALLPATPVVEVDAGTAAIPDVGATGVLIGTEAVLQRVEVRRLRPVLVAFLDFDQELLAPRSRAAEQALWLVVRAARLVAGRDRSRTRVLLQTRLSEHEVVRAAVTGDPALVADAERVRRRALGFPPFGGLAEISGVVAAVDSVAAALTARAGDGSGVSVLGPDRKGETARALVRGPDPDAVADALAAAVPPARALGRLHVEVDPTRI